MELDEIQKAVVGDVRKFVLDGVRALSQMTVEKMASVAFTAKDLRDGVLELGLLPRAIVWKMKKLELATWLVKYYGGLRGLVSNIDAKEHAMSTALSEMEKAVEEADIGRQQAEALTARFRAYEDFWRARVLDLDVEVAKATHTNAVHQSWFVFMLHDMGLWLELDPDQRARVLSNIEDPRMRDFLIKFGGAKVVQPFGKTSM